MSLLLIFSILSSAAIGFQFFELVTPDQTSDDSESLPTEGDVPTGDNLVFGDNEIGYGSQGDDTLDAGNSRYVTLYGGAGDDVLTAAHHSRLFGEAGNDTISATESTIDGGIGNDLIDGQDFSSILGGEGNDTISGLRAISADGQEGDDLLDAHSFSTLSGGMGDDVLSSGEASQLFGNEGNDVLTLENDGLPMLPSEADGGEGNDLIYGVDNTTLLGGKGDDTISATFAFLPNNMSPSPSISIDGGEGEDQISISVQAGNGSAVAMDAIDIRIDDFNTNEDSLIIANSSDGSVVENVNILFDATTNSSTIALSVSNPALPGEVQICHIEMPNSGPVTEEMILIDSSA